MSAGEFGGYECANALQYGCPYWTTIAQTPCVTCKVNHFIYILETAAIWYGILAKLSRSPRRAVLFRFLDLYHRRYHFFERIIPGFPYWVWRPRYHRHKKNR